MIFRPYSGWFSWNMLRITLKWAWIFNKMSKIMNCIHSELLTNTASSDCSIILRFSFSFTKEKSSVCLQPCKYANNPRDQTRLAFLCKKQISYQEVAQARFQHPPHVRTPSHQHLGRQVYTWLLGMYGKRKFKKQLTSIELTSNTVTLV